MDKGGNTSLAHACAQEGNTGRKKKAAATLRMASRSMVLFLAASMVQAAAPVDPTLTTLAGGGVYGTLGDGGPATSAYLSDPQDVAVDATGNVYIADKGNRRVRKITPAGVISTVAGNGTATYNGDGIAATSTGLVPAGIAVDAIGNLYISSGHRIVKVTPAGIINTVAGNSTSGFSGDNGPATAASLYGPSDVEVDPAGNLYVADYGNKRIRKVSTGGTITTVAGNGSSINTECGCNGDGMPAVQASVSEPRGIAFDAAGNLYIADWFVGLRRVDRAGIINTVAGGGLFGGDPMATNVALFARDLSFDSRGNAYISHNNLVLMLSIDGSLHVVAGEVDQSAGGFNGETGFSGDGGPATQGLLATPLGIAVDAQGNVLIADSANNRIRKVNAIPQPPTPLGMFKFAQYRSLETAESNRSVSVGDVNGDGLDDIIFTNAGDPLSPNNSVDFYMVGISLQRADGTLAERIPVSREWATDGQPRAFAGGGLALADFNRDGVKDIVVSHGSGIELIAGSRTGNFVARSFSGANNAPAEELLALDANRDGNMDVVAHGTASAVDPSQGIAVYFGNGAGGTSARTFKAAPFQFAGLASGDLNGDGLIDLATGFTEGPAGGVAVFLYDPVQGFLPASKFNSSDAGWTGVSIGDFNDDGRKDVVVNRREFTNSPMIGLFAQNASGQLVGPTNLLTAYTPDATVVADMNGDGRDDLMVVHVETWAMGYYQQGNNGLAGEIKYQIDPAQLYRVNSLATGDINHDGIKDVVIANTEGLVLLYGTGRRDGIRVGGSQPRLPRTPGGAVGAHAASAAPVVNDSVRLDDIEAGETVVEISRPPSRIVRQWEGLRRIWQANASRIGIRTVLATFLGRNQSWANSLHAWLQLLVPTHHQEVEGHLASTASTASTDVIPVYRGYMMNTINGEPHRRVCRRSP